MNLPEYKDLRMRVTEDGKHQVLDILRRRFVNLTPEEWVRQHFIHFLITEKGYPQGLLANEVELKVADKKLRCDSVLFDQNRQPKVVIEYKAESVELTPKVIRQITTYNMLLNVDYLMISNGLVHLCLHYEKNDDKWVFVKEIPQYEELIVKN